MRWKLLLTSLLIIGIVALAFFRYGPKQIISGMLSFIGSFYSPQPGSPFKIEMTAKIDAFMNQKYQVSFSQAGMGIEKLTLENVEGEVKRLWSGQWFSQTINKGSIEIENFLGNINIDPNMSTITLSGYASRVKGTNFEGSIFEWIG